MFKTIRSWRALGIGLSAAILASAAPKTRASEPPPACIEATVLSKPCGGLLIPFADAEACLKTRLDLGAALEQNEILGKLHQADLLDLEARLATEQKRANELSGLLDKHLNLPKPAFYETVWFGIAVGVVGTVALAFAVREVGE